MADWLMPDRVFAHFYDITPQYLGSLGIAALLIDIDNTLAPYELAKPDEKTVCWFKDLQNNGIKAALISNNERERVELFNKDLGLPAFYKSGKPFAKKLKKAMAIMQSNTANTAVIGDQLLTDVMAGKHMGMRAFLVPPIKDRTSAFFRFKRALEVPKIRKYARISGDGDESVLACDFWINKRYKIRKQR
ncbi:MAG: YqeG family HAD IIIA-type phosphatase [Ruminococcaceae bacterium]|nr:YqeG family HAD IIIA-type phosphatase [Oscillospiraceae bacterium]